MGNPSGDELHGGGQSFQGLMREVIAFEAAEKGLDQTIGLGAAARGVAGNQAQTCYQLPEVIRDKFRSVVGEELQTFGLVWLVGEALEEGFAEKFANLQCGQPHLQLPGDDHAVGTIDDDGQPKFLLVPEFEGGDVASPAPVGAQDGHLAFVPST